MDFILGMLFTGALGLLGGWFLGTSAAVRQLSPTINKLFDQIEELEKEKNQ